MADADAAADADADADADAAVGTLTDDRRRKDRPDEAIEEVGPETSLNDVVDPQHRRQGHRPDPWWKIRKFLEIKGFAWVRN